MLEHLQQVLAQAHEQHVYITDKEQYGQDDYWKPGLRGDCEDFALWCRDRLMERGIDTRLVYCTTETGGGHCVLAWQGYILDNRYFGVRRNDDLPYDFIAFCEPDGKWYLIDK